VGAGRRISADPWSSIDQRGSKTFGASAFVSSPPAKGPDSRRIDARLGAVWLSLALLRAEEEDTAGGTHCGMKCYLISRDSSLQSRYISHPFGEQTGVGALDSPSTVSCQAELLFWRCDSIVVAQLGDQAFRLQRENGSSSGWRRSARAELGARCSSGSLELALLSILRSAAL